MLTILTSVAGRFRVLPLRTAPAASKDPQRTAGPWTYAPEEPSLVWFGCSFWVDDLFDVEEKSQRRTKLQKHSRRRAKCSQPTEPLRVASCKNMLQLSDEAGTKAPMPERTTSE